MESLLESNFERPVGEAEKLIVDELIKLTDKEQGFLDELTESVWRFEEINKTLKEEKVASSNGSLNEKIQSVEVQRNLEEKMRELMEVQKGIVEQVEQIDERVKTLQAILESDPNQN